MIKKFLVLFVAAVMVFTMTAFAAEETKSEEGGSNIGEALGQLGESLGEAVSNFDLGGALEGVVTKLGDDGSIGETLKGLLGNITDESGSFDASQIKQFLGSLFGGSDDTDAGDVVDTDDADDADDTDDVAASDEEDMFSMEVIEALENAIHEHLADETGEYLEAGDETVFSEVIVDDDMHEDGTIHILGYYAIVNFDANDTDLLVKNGAGLAELLTLEKQEDGTYEVTDFITAEDGEAYTDSVAEMCAAMDIDPDDFYEAMAVNDLTYACDLYCFLYDHPEYERIEVLGELMTMDDLDALIDELFDEYLALYEIEEAVEE